MRGVLGAAFIILGLAGGYLILTGRFPPAPGASSISSSGVTSSTPDGGPTATGGKPTTVNGTVIGITPHVMGLPTVVNLSDQAASLGGYK